MRIMGQAAIADLFGVSEVAINEWQDAGMPVVARGQAPKPNEYDSVECIRWLVERERRKVQGESPRDRVFRLQADKLELELAQQRGTMIPSALIEPRMREVMIAAREFLRGEPPRLAVLLEGKSKGEREDALRAIFDELLRRLADWRGASAGEPAQ
jgi:phage terminase Nu1 subunit (DNA packaging protein)